MAHKLGQVFLKDKNIIAKILSFASLHPTDSVVEIGCGHGDLTQALVACVDHVRVIEVDNACIERTRQRLGDSSSLSFYHANVLKVDLASLSTEKVTIVANLPYYISAPILKWILHSFSSIKEAVIMVQKEFALKLMANAHDDVYTSFTVFVRAYADVEYGFRVSRSCFRPIPKVDSAVIRLVPHKRLPKEVDSTIFFNMVRSVFWGRRKPLVSALKKSPYLSLKKGFNTATLCNSWAGRRGESLSFDEFLQLYSFIKEYV